MAAKCREAKLTRLSGGHQKRGEKPHLMAPKRGVCLRFFKTMDSPRAYRRSTFGGENITKRPGMIAF